MSTTEADHDRGRYYMHTGYTPIQGMEHPSYGAVVAHELLPERKGLEIPPFIAVGGASQGPGFLGMSYAPLNVSSDGRIRNLDTQVADARLIQRMKTLELIEQGFNRQNRGASSSEHTKVLEKTYQLLTSRQVDAFSLDSKRTRSKKMR